MRSKAKSAKAFTVSLVLHLIAGAIGFFYWYTPKVGVEQEAIETILVAAKKPEAKRIMRRKRTQVERKATTTSQVQLKILTSEAPATNRGIVSATEPTKFDPLARIDLGGTGNLTTTAGLSHRVPKIERVIENPIKKKEGVEEGPPKSRLVKFIERQQGPQRLIYCVDISSSMVGLKPRKLQKIIRILQDSLTFLELHDSFNLMTFSDTAAFYRHDFVTRNDENISQATTYLDTVKPTRSQSYTDKDMLEALTEAQTVNPTIIVLFSDGIPTSGFPKLDELKQYINKNTRIFTMAIEMAEDFPGAVLLRRLADDSDGEFWLVDGSR